MASQTAQRNSSVLGGLPQCCVRGEWQLPVLRLQCWRICRDDIGRAGARGCRCRDSTRAARWVGGHSRCWPPCYSPNSYLQPSRRTDAAI